MTTAKRRYWGIVTAGIGLLMLGWAMVATGLDLWGRTRSCPDFGRGPAGAAVWIYAAEGSIRLGRPACLNLRPATFFGKERAAIELQAKALKAAQDSLARIDANATDAQTVAARNTAKARVTQEQAALAQLPQRRRVFLYLDDVKVPMEGREVDVMAGSRERPWVRVDMPLRGVEDAASDDGKTWRKILGGPTDYGARGVQIGVAVAEAEDRAPTLRAVLRPEKGRADGRPQAVLRVFNPGRVLLGGAGLLLLALGVAVAGWNTGLLRDGGPESPFSLGRAQMAWWLVLTIGGFLFIWLVSGQWKGVVTAGVIGLLGISATTGVAARLIDTSGGEGSPPDADAASKGFWQDLVQDGDGAALHRLQMLAWTIILGAVFVWTVLWSFGFPDFDTNLLLLAGIASGTYLGFKFQEPPLDGSSPP